MRGTGFRTALDRLKPIFDTIEPSSTQFLPLSVDFYGLHKREVLDRIAKLADTRRGTQVRAYNARSPVDLPAIEPRSIEELFAHSKELKYTFNIEYLDAHIPELSALAIDLAAFFGATVAIHAFVSGAGVPSTPLHYDYTNAFTFQLYGSKRWQCFDYLETPTYNPGGYVVEPDKVGRSTLDRVLHPGDTLFVPKGGLHLVSALPDADSVHLAVSVKNLGCYKFIAPFLDPEMDDPEWAGTDFERHVSWLSAGIEKFSERATNGNALKLARTTIWQLIYAQHNRSQYHPPKNVSSERRGPALLHRTIGRPLMVTRSDDSIDVEVLDPSAGLVGNSSVGFQPAKVQLPVEAEPYVQMLEAGELSAGRLAEIYDRETSEGLLSLALDLELFHYAGEEPAHR